MAKIKFGYDRLREQAYASVSGYIHAMEADAPGDSPIEKLFFVSLSTYVVTSGCEYDNAVLVKDAEALERFKTYAWAKHCLLVQSQVQLEDWRVDFLIHSWDWGAWRNADPGWSQLVVECDGHDFHERTKEQAARDRSRDRSVQARGLKVFRFTGSELWRDPWDCAREVVDWAAQGL